MEFSAKQIVPPKDWGRFEDLCLAIFRAAWGDTYAQKNGRTGQSQHGVDISSSSPSGPQCIQCKGKDHNYGGRVTPSEFDAELAKAEKFSPTPSYWALATTAPNDARLQEHVRRRSDEREAAGKFPVNVLGWETLVALIGGHPSVIREFYQEHSDQIEEMLETLRKLPGRDEIEAIVQSVSGKAAQGSAPQAWEPVSFEKQRGFGPALLGRALGAADVGFCPRLPEAEVLVGELTIGYSARLAGVPGAGKSVCALQAAETLAEKGFRVVRLRDPRVAELDLTGDDVPTIHLIDDAHLTGRVAIAHAEKSTTPDKLLLSTFTTVDMASTAPGTVHLDATRAVRVIANDLRKRPEEVLAAVRQLDDWIGNGRGDERLEGRLEEAEKAEFPWQFCFVLSGGWRRVNAIVASARVGKADLVLAAIAIRQLASRDAPATSADLSSLLTAGGLDPADARKALSWLVDQRIVISGEDLRCPHQRFAAKVFDPVLQDQTSEGRKRVGAMMACALSDPTLPLSGLGTLLTEFRMSSSGYGWTSLVDRTVLGPFLARCWAAETAEDIAAAARILREIDSYIPDAITRPGRHAVETVARWFSSPRPIMAHAVGSYLNGTYRNRRYGRAIVRASDPDAIAAAHNAALTVATAEFASDIGNMITSAHAALTPEWTAQYLSRIDRRKCLALAANWPKTSSLYHAAWFCQGFIHLDEAFGLELIDALGPSIGARMREEPIKAFRQLEDIFWSSLRIYDPLQVYVGKLKPTNGMRATCARLCAQWEPSELARKLTQASSHEFRDAAGLLNILHKSAPDLHAATVAALDWDAVDRSLGSDWSKLPDHGVTFLCQFFEDKSGRAAAARLIERHLDQMDPLDDRLAFIAPAAAVRQLDRNGSINLGIHHAHWVASAFVLVEVHKSRPDLVPKLLNPHLEGIAKALSSESPSSYEQSLIFIRVCEQVAPEAFEAILSKINDTAAARGWVEILSATGRRGSRLRDRGARDAVAWLLHHLRNRDGSLGDQARRVASEFPTESRISAKKLEHFDDL